VTCCVCGEPAVVSRMYEDMCQFHWDCLRHELKIRLDGIRDFGEGHYYGPQFGCTFYGRTQGGKSTTLGLCLYVSYSPKEAMQEALRIARRNNWKLLRLDVQGGAEKRLGLWSCTNLFVSPEFQTYMEYSDLGAMCYDEAKWGRIEL
jgi:hypothetical protein